MTKRLFALLLTLVMVLQPVLPAAAEAVGEVTEATEETVEVTEEVTEAPTGEVAEEVTEEPTEEAAEEATEEPTEEVTEEVTEATEEAEATGTTESESITYVTVHFLCDYDDVILHVFPAATEENPEPEEIIVQENGSYHLAPGTYTYSAERDGLIPIERDPFLVSEENVGKEIEIHILMEAESYDSSTTSGRGTTGNSTWFVNAYVVRIYGGSYMAGYSALGAGSNAPWATLGTTLYEAQIEGSITEIGANAFRGETLNVATITAPVQTIGIQAFQNCKQLLGIDLPSTVKLIKSNAFSGAGLVAIGIPSGIQTIQEDAFANCENLSTVFFGGSKSDWDNIAIASGNEALTSARIIYNFSGKAVLQTEWGSNAFNCNWIEDGTHTLTMLGNGDIHLPSSRGNVRHLVVNGNVRINPSTLAASFGQCDDLREVEIIGNPSLGRMPFSGCDKLERITLPQNWGQIPDEYLMESGLSSYQIPEQITTIGKKVFYGCSNLRTVYIPATVKEIGANCFPVNVSKVYYGGTESQWNKISIDDGNHLPTPEFLHVHSYVTEDTDVYGENIYLCECGSYSYEAPVPTLQNTIIANDITLEANATKAQTVSLNASALGDAALSYRSDNAAVKVNAQGVVTVAAGFVGTAKITITSAATALYFEATKVITVTAKVITDAELTLPSQKALAGKSLTVPVLLTKNSGIAGFGLTVNYDDSVLTLNSITVGSAISGNGTFSTNGNITTWYTVDNTTVTGELMQLNFTVKEDAPEGDTEVTVALTDGLDSNLSDEDGNPVSVTITAGTITVTRGILGDVNGDGSVAIADVVLLNRSVLGKVTLTDTAKKLGDVNGDGNISIADVVKLNRYVLKKITALASPATGTVDSVVDFNALPASISVGTVDGKAGQTVTVPVRISGNPGIAGYSLKVNYDASALTLNAMTAGSLISGNGTFSVNDEAHIINWYTVDNLSGDGELLNLSFTVREGAAEGTIPVSVSLNDDLDSNLSDEDGMAVPVTFVSGGIRIAKAQSGTFGNLTWQLSDDSTLTVGGTGEMDSFGYPWEDYASTVRRLEVQSGVTNIAEYAFSGFDALEEVVLGDTVTTIGQSAFSMCGKLRKLDLGSGLRVIYNYSFESCDSLEEVTLPAAASSISPTAFENCGSLQNFHVVSGNETYCDVDGVLFWTGKVLLANFPGGRTGSYTVPGSVKTIGDCAFYASKLTEVVLPSGLKTIGDYCFRYSAVSQLTLPAGLENLGVGAFAGCQELKAVTIPGSVKTVSDSAFWGSGLESVTLEDGITAIEKEAFLSCGLTEVTIPSTVTSISEHALGYEANRMDYDKVAGFTITGLEGSAAQQYADDNGFQFEKIPMTLQLNIPDSITAGKSIQLKAEVIPAQYDTGKYTWSLKNAADSAYVTLSGSKLTAKAVPETLTVTLVCANGNLQAEKTITVVPTLAGISIYRGEDTVNGTLTVDLNETETVVLSAKALPEGAALDPVWSWNDTKGTFGSYSQEDGVLTVELNTGAKLGTVTLTVKDRATKKAAALKLTTTRKSNGEITILGGGDALTGGSAVQLKAQLEGSPANTKVTWSLDPEDQAYGTITAAGKLTATQVTENHTITVYAKAVDGGSVGEREITVVPRASGLRLTMDGQSVSKAITVYLNDAKELTLEATTWPADASNDVTWTVPKNKITGWEVVDGKLHLYDFTGTTGAVTVKATAKDGSKKAVSLQIKFARRADCVEILDSKGREIEDAITLKGKQSYSFKAKLTADGGKITDQDLVWSVSSWAEGYVTVKNGKVTVKSFAAEEPLEVYLSVALKSSPETSSEVALVLKPDLKAGVNIYDNDEILLNNKTYYADLSEEMIFLEAEAVGLGDDRIVWGPTNPKGAATVEEDGTVTLHKAGTVAITATNPASKKKATFKLVVTDKVKELTIQNAPEELSGGKRVTLKATMTPNKATNGKLSWYLVDNGGGAASLTTAGVLTAAKVTGVKTVTAAVRTQDGTMVSEPVDIRIIPAATRVMISGTPDKGIVDLNTCDSLSLTARVYPSVASQTVKWTSNNKLVRVDGDGEVTILDGAKPGAVTLTAAATDGSGKKASVKLTLTRYVEDISMVSTATVVGGKTIKLTATPDKAATNKKLVWSMSGDTAYCTLSSGTLKTKAVTTTKLVVVTATAADGSGTYAQCLVTIQPNK